MDLVELAIALLVAPVSSWYNVLGIVALFQALGDLGETLGNVFRYRR